jgi:hypothetical protein
MVETKCIEVDNKQATLAHAETLDQRSQPRNKTDRMMSHEHHDFFVGADQSPVVSTDEANDV